MMPSPRNLLIAAVLAAGLGAPGRAAAQGTPSAHQQAEALNNEGKALIKQLDLTGAAQRFRAAMALSDDPRFSFNLCYTLEKSGQLAEAKAACERVMASGEPRLAQKANKLLAVIEDSMAGRPASPTPDGPQPIAPPRQPPGPPPAPPVASTPPEPKKNARFGAAVGVSRANIDSGVGDTDAVLGFAFGAWMRLPVRRAFETIFEAQVVQRGFQAGGDDLASAELNSLYIDLGFASRWHMGSGGFRPYLEAGMSASLLLNATARIGGMGVSPEQQPFDVAYALALGTRVDIGGNQFDIRARYNHGLLNINNSDAGPANDSGSAYNRSTQIQVGMWF